MLNFIYESGPLISGIITLIFFIMLVVSYVNGMPIIKGANQDFDKHRNRIGYIKSLGMLALVIGILGQLIGLYSAFGAMSTMEGGIAPNILTAGLKTSLASTIYGVVIFMISYLIWLGLSWKLRTTAS